MYSAKLKIYSETKNDIENFLSKFYDSEYILENKNYYEITFNHPQKMLDIISCYSDNSDQFNISLWISLDKDIYILITQNNIDEIIKYIYERYPEE